MRRAAVALMLLGLVALGAVMLVPPLLGYERYVIEGGSMGDALPRGSIAFAEPVPVGRLRVGDVITYRPPAAPARLVTHRVVWIGNGRRFRTRGDANPTADPWRFTLPARAQARVAFHVPLAGYALAALSVRALRMLVIGVPALAIAVGAITGLWSEAASAEEARA